MKRGKSRWNPIEKRGYYDHTIIPMIAPKRTHAESEISYYKTFIRGYLSGDERYSSLVKDVLAECMRFKAGERDVYTIERASFNITMRIVEINMIPDTMEDVTREYLTELEAAL